MDSSIVRIEWSIQRIKLHINDQEDGHYRDGSDGDDGEEDGEGCGGHGGDPQSGG